MMLAHPPLMSWRWRVISCSGSRLLGRSSGYCSISGPTAVSAFTPRRQIRSLSGAARWPWVPRSVTGTEGHQCIISRSEVPR
jgi:hypothetical protein